MTNIAAIRLLDDVELAASVVPPQWPLDGAVATNPLQGLEHLGFSAARTRAEALFGSRGHLTLAELRDAHRRGRVPAEHLEAALARRVGPQPDEVVELLLVDLIAGADDPPPRRWATTIAEQVDQGRGTAHLAAIDRELAELCARWCTDADGDDRPGLWATWWDEHRDGPAPDPLLALQEAFDRLRVPPYAQRRYLEAHVAALPGWVGHLRWRQAHHGGTPVVDYLAARVVLEAELVADDAWYQADGPLPRPAEASLRDRTAAVAREVGAPDDRLDAIAAALALLDGRQRAEVWQDAYERSVHDPLLAAVEPGPVPAAPTAELVCCIDVRSERLRRHLEALGPYATHGYAGFFGLPIHLQPAAGGEGTDQCPVLLTPDRTIAEVAPEGRAADHRRWLAGRQASAAGDAAWHAAKHHPMAPLALAEGAGWVTGALAIARTAAPRIAARVADRVAGLGPDPAVEFDRSTVPVAVQADWVAAMLGLGIGAASLVVLCGHEARADNNAFETALACGACAGHSGAANARIAAAAANDPAVRAELAARGTPVPEGTWFLAGVHETTTDAVELFDLELVPDEHGGALAQLVADLGRAGDATALERAAALGDRRDDDRRTLRRVRGRGRDWSEPVAELGLAGNAAFIAGPRSLTRGTDLGGRAFLHSYEPARDPDGSILAGILTAPLVVAQWINAQYHFSATDPEILGAGSKAVHNPIGRLGVLSGPGGDLRRGLPLQSVRAGSTLLHEPVRLLAVIAGRLDHIDAAIAGSPTLRTLVEGEWIHLVARPGPDEPWQQRTADGWTQREPLPVRPAETWAVAS